MKSSTVLPFFMWRTVGTTAKMPKTFPPKLYQIVGTLFDRFEVTKDDHDLNPDINSTTVTSAANETTDNTDTQTTGITLGSVTVANSSEATTQVASTKITTDTNNDSATTVVATT
ncbi:unnamed protein product [Leptidea sinapis]|uniref:Uncharacterized protein n=1 Tax=Leptidea sinapis TaxID=189913 RepID=A0A5E4QTX7_9NEOP|nr:unnamed protein product [Leptidea sinapis]